MKNQLTIPTTIMSLSFISTTIVNAQQQSNVAAGIGNVLTNNIPWRAGHASGKKIVSINKFHYLLCF